MVPSPSVTASKPNYCFACGEANPDGLHLHFDYDPGHRSVECRLQLHARYQGATGYAHGGMIATLLDEAMAKVNGKEGIRAVTLRLTLSFLKLVPIEQEVRLTARRTKRRGRKLYLSAQLWDQNNTLLAMGKGLFLAVTPSIGSDSKQSKLAR